MASRFAVLPAAVVLTVLAACSAGGTSGPAHSSAQSSSAQSSSMESSSTRALARERASTPHPTQTSSPACAALTPSSVADLLNGGEAVALIQARVTAPPSAPTDSSEQQPIADATLLAGRLPSGTPTTLQVAESGSNKLLPPGDYVLIVGQTPGFAGYFLSDGAAGIFTLSARNDVSELCPDSNGTLEPRPDGPERALVSLVAAAFSHRDAATSPPRPTPTVSPSDASST